MMGKLDCRRRKKMCNNRRHEQLSSPLLRLPQALITEIIASVAASSFNDFLITKSICKDFYERPEEEEGCIYRRVSLKEFPIVAWRNKEKYSQFFKNCYKNKNPEALYREGVVHYFGGARLDLAIDCLEEAASLGHRGAYYAVGIIYVLSGEELKQKGIDILGGLRKSKTMRDEVKNYRRNLKLIISKIWRNPLLARERKPCCRMQHQRKQGWSIDEIEENSNMCEACFSDMEVETILRAL